MRHIAVIKAKPVLSGVSSTPDGAINGNGDLAVILGNSPEGLRIYIAKNDIWYGVEQKLIGGVRPLGYIDIPVKQSLYDNYYVEQDMDLGELRCNFEKENEKCNFTVFVCKTENAIIIRNSGNVDILPELKVYEGDTDGRKGIFEQDGIKGIFRSFDDEYCEYETHCFASLKKINKDCYYFFTATNHDINNPMQIVADKINAADDEYIKKITELHASAWKEMWSKSSFRISDEEFETGWYSSQYFLAVSAGNTNFPPGIFGNFITVERPNWSNDYHMNYNYQAPFYAACSSNHVEFTDCYMSPLEEALPRGREFAKRHGCRGILYPVGLSPKGVCTEYDKRVKYPFERLFLGQKSNQIHPADIPIFRWKATRDLNYAREHAYPYVKECLQFFEDYGIWEDGRFSICRDATHEVPFYSLNFKLKKYKRYINDKNNALTLGMLRLGLEAGIDMAVALNIDEDKQKIWKKILDNLSPFSTYYRFGKKVYRYTEKGQMWNNGGDVGLQHIYPGGCVGLSSSEEDLEIARNTYKMKEKYCYIDDNAVSSFFPMGARLGVEPSLLTDKFRELNKKVRLPNLIYKFGGGCLEDCSIPATLFNEMAMQSHQGDLRLFPCWDNRLDCEFENLRADGAFLVSSSIKKGKMGQTTIICEVGGKLNVILPYNNIIVNHNGNVLMISENTFSLDTKPGDIINIR